MTDQKDHSRVFFCSATDNYVKHCVVTIKSFQKYYKEEDFFIIGSFFSEKSMQLMDLNNISYLTIPILKKIFHNYTYPAECFFHFYGPKLFTELGYKWSIYLDGDLYCNKKFPMVFPKWFATISNGTIFDVLKKDVRGIKQVFGNFGSMKNIRRTQSGVIIYNNENLQKINFFLKIRRLYEISIKNNIPRKGDDSLLNLFVYVYQKFSPLRLPIEYNFTLKKTRSPNKIYIYHFCQFCKPWDKNPAKIRASSVLHRHFLKKWKTIQA